MNPACSTTCYTTGIPYWCLKFNMYTQQQQQKRIKEEPTTFFSTSNSSLIPDLVHNIIVSQLLWLKKNITRPLTSTSTLHYSLQNISKIKFNDPTSAIISHQSLFLQSLLSSGPHYFLLNYHDSLLTYLPTSTFSPSHALLYTTVR